VDNASDKVIVQNGLIKGIKISNDLSITHLLFVDDVILFGMGTIEDWTAFKVILETFCEASGMNINLDKSYFLHYNVNDSILRRVSDILPYRFAHLELGFTYLGFFLKPSGYLVKDWLWLIKRFESCIKHWTNRLLSLGGRLVLIRVVLTSLPVYWCALFPIPSSILDKLRKLIFNFLWGSSAVKKKFHLVDWQLLARPISLGGWGIKHLPLFCISLRMKNFWFALNNSGIWNQLIRTKYMKNMSIQSWCRNKYFRLTNTSRIWMGFIKTLHWIGQGLIWQVGKGTEVIVGADPIVGLGSSFILPYELRTYLDDYGINTLAQAINHDTGLWFTAEELDLCDVWSLQWSTYIKGLEYNRIGLNEEPDTLLWSTGNYEGPISAAKSYECLVKNNIRDVHNQDCIQLWSLKIPLKIICFIWLLDKDRILTWDHLQSRGYYGPSRCVLCKKATEDCGHLFLMCPFVNNIFSHFSIFLGSIICPHSTVHSFLEYWFASTAISDPIRYTPIFIFWHLWLLRNQCIFENCIPLASALIIKIEYILALFPVPQYKKKIRLIGPQPIHVYPVGYFDGAAQRNLGGAGFVIYISETHYYCFSVGCGNGSNTRTELLALWSLLRTVILMGLPIKMIFGDSMVVISWVKRRSALNIPTLKHWCDEIFAMLHFVPSVTFNHIFREHNILADELSKKALSLDMGSGYYSEYLDGKHIGDGQFALF